jgi:RND superfamily putative drug exporter
MPHAPDPSVATRRRWVLPALVVLVWVVIGALAGPYSGKLSEVQKNDNASFLPANAEATQVADLQKKFSDQVVNPTVIVYERTSGITAADRAKAASDVAAVQRSSAVVGPVSPPIPSRDGKAIEVVVPLNGDLGMKVVDAVDAIRSTVRAGAPPGLTVHVTGPGGLAADFVKAFAGIDGVLLLVALAVVLVILVVVYRSPILPFIVLISAVFGLSLASGVIYALAKNGSITLNGQSQGILFILVVGAATDYSLLLVSRYREELREQSSRYDAIRSALRQSLAPIVASGTTVILGVLCLLFSDLNSNRGLGPVAAIGIVGSLLAALTFLPAVLALFGRAAFWPLRPQLGSPHREEQGIWARAAALVARHPRWLWVVITVVLLGLAAFLPSLRASGVEQTKLFLVAEESVKGQDVLAAHFPAGVGSPVVIIGPANAADSIVATARSTPGVASAVAQPKVVDGLVEVDGVLAAAGDSAAAERTVVNLRQALHASVPGTQVGGFTAIQYDVQRTATRDRSVIIPIVLVVILLVLMVLLRALLAPVLLVLTVVLSFAATLGVSALVFNHLFHFPGADPAVPLYGFVFLVALGIDYNIFLMTRVREESVRRGTRPGILRGLMLTGGVITSAGVVLAATFSALGVIPILFLAQIAFIVSFGVLLDTLVVRSLLVPALSYDIGSAIWWPSRLSRTQPHMPEETPEPAVAQPR